MAPRLTGISITLLAAGLVFSTLAYAENVYRWADEDGKIHYGRTLPPDHANRPYELLNDAGVVIERVEDPLALQMEPSETEESTELAPLFTPDEVRVRSDNLLMLRYNNEEDLISAMQVKIDELGYDARLINQSRSSTMTAMAGHISNAANRQRAGMPEESELEKNIYSLRQRLKRSEGQLIALKDREVKIRATFEQNLVRYRFLINGGRPGEIDSSSDSD